MSLLGLPQIRLWSFGREGNHVVNFKMALTSQNKFTFDAWIVDTGAHIGVHSPHSHRPYFHLQIKESLNSETLYSELDSDRSLKFYAEIFDNSVRKVFGINAWQVFS